MINPETLRNLDADSLTSALMGCSFELSLVGEVEEPEGEEFQSEAELSEDMAQMIAEIQRRLNNADPDMQDAVAKKAAWWREITKRFKQN